MPALQGWVATKLCLIQRDHLRCSLITSDSSSTCRPIILQHRAHSGSLTAFCFDYGHPCWCRANLALEEEVRKLQAAFWTQPLELNTAVAVLLEVDQVYQQVFTPCCTTSTDHNISSSFANCFLACSQLIGNLMQQMQTVNATTWSYNHLDICIINVTESNLCWDAVSFDISLVDFSYSTCAVVPGRSTNHHPPKCLFCQLVTWQGCAQSEGTCCLPTALLVHFAETLFFAQGMRDVMTCLWKLWKSFAAINVMLRGSQGGLHLWLWCRSIGGMCHSYLGFAPMFQRSARANWFGTVLNGIEMILRAQTYSV